MFNFGVIDSHLCQQAVSGTSEKASAIGRRDCGYHRGSRRCGCSCRTRASGNCQTACSRAAKRTSGRDRWARPPSGGTSHKGQTRRQSHKSRQTHRQTRTGLLERRLGQQREIDSRTSSEVVLVVESEVAKRSQPSNHALYIHQRKNPTQVCYDIHNSHDQHERHTLCGGRSSMLLVLCVRTCNRKKSSPSSLLLALRC